MSIGTLFKLAKLRILAYSNAERRKSLTGNNVFEVQYNPQTLSIRHEIAVVSQPVIGGQIAKQCFTHAVPRNLTVNLVVDGSNVGNLGIERLRHLATVSERIDEFLDVCYRIDTEAHEPPFLRLEWNKGVLPEHFDCRLKSTDIKYTSFERDGSPRHAEITANFVESLDATDISAKTTKVSSPDLTHRRTVLAGDTLPSLCVAIYGSAEHYLSVARHNNLEQFRRIEPGTELLFPPLTGKGAEV
jgi:hypothetical protein